MADVTPRRVVLAAARAELPALRRAMKRRAPANGHWRRVLQIAVGDEDLPEDAGDGSMLLGAAICLDLVTGDQLLTFLANLIDDELRALVAAGDLA